MTDWKFLFEHWLKSTTTALDIPPERHSHENGNPVMVAAKSRKFRKGTSGGRKGARAGMDSRFRGNDELVEFQVDFTSLKSFFRKRD